MPARPILPPVAGTGGSEVGARGMSTRGLATRSSRRNAPCFSKTAKSLNDEKHVCERKKRTMDTLLIPIQYPVPVARRAGRPWWLRVPAVAAQGAELASNLLMSPLLVMRYADCSPGEPGIHSTVDAAQPNQSSEKGYFSKSGQPGHVQDCRDAVPKQHRFGHG